jgi:hypothetical protein
MTMPPSFIQSGSLHGTAEALQEEVKNAYRGSGSGLTIGRRREAHARQMGQMAAGGIAMQNLSQEELHGRDWRQPTVASEGIPDLTARSQNGFGLQ